jgi:hypothetical protein
MLPFIQYKLLEHDNNHSQNTSNRFYAFNTKVVVVGCVKAITVFEKTQN